jgi:hypothetical protein
MAVILALPRLYDAVVARFLAEAPLPDLVPICTQYFGWREVAKQHVGPRIVWVPGMPNGDLGPIVAPKYPGNRAAGRPLLNTPEAFHCYVTGYDTTAKTDERAQYTAARLLYDELIRAIYLEAHGTIGESKSGWVIDKKEFRAGATILFTSSVQAVHPDHEATTAPANTGAIIEIEELDYTEELRVPEGHVPTVP